ncbi:glycosyltransferase family 61 protein [Natrinema sp. SYSU A 869]|uniref:glycosyltransferase family 61 protein n=1 Tax=Natrinema sp. SYSU A 869 TaxID=2871694 RepID=UPI001CA43116|nr:glycosyltransferase family 61 protein [Natrinema sp. SYSU A 869]
MTLFRHGLRKVRRDGVYQFCKQAKEEVVQDNILRHYTGGKIDEETDITTVNEISNSGHLISRDCIETDLHEIPRKESVKSDEQITDIQADEPCPQVCGIVNGATVLASSGIVSLPDGRFVADSVGPVHLASRRVSVALSMFGYQHGFAQLRAVLPSTEQDLQPDRTVDKAIVLIPLWSNYFHWTVECLLKLHWLERYRKTSSDNVKIIVPRTLSSWMHESLSLLGYDESDYISAESRKIIVNELLIPSQIEPIPAHVNWLRDRISDSVEVTEQEDKRIYITRRKATKRRVRNEGEVITALRTRGFEPYALESLSVSEQVRLFSNSSAVVGPHGAGFANIIYSNDTTVIELFGQKRLNTYQRLATALGFGYEPVYCDGHGSDLVVDTDNLLKTVDDQLSTI